MIKRFFSLLCCIGAALGVCADGFRDHRFDTFRVMPITEQSIVFVGNSISDMHPWIEAWGGDPRIVDRGVSGANSAEILANARSYCAGHPAKIFMMIGVNDKPNKGNYAKIVANIEKTIQIFRAESPTTELYVESILPTAWNNGNANIAPCNALIRKMVARYPGVTYIDLYSKLVGKSNVDGKYSYDRLHITAAGYQIWMAEIEKYMGGLRSLYPTNTVSLMTSKGLPHNSFGMRGTYFSMMPIASDDVLFFGDEMVKNGEWAELLRNPRVKNRGTNWGYEKAAPLMHIVSENIDCTFAPVPGVEKKAPRHILLYTATGEVNGSGSLSAIVDKYSALVGKLRGYAPDARISLVSLMPTQGYSNDRVRQFNAAIEQLATSADGVDYIDIFSTLVASDGEADKRYFPAGDCFLHGDGYIAISAVLARHIDGCTPITPAQAAAYRAASAAPEDAKQRH